MTSYQGKLYMINEIGQYRMLYDIISYQGKLYMINEIGQYRMLYDIISGEIVYDK